MRRKGFTLTELLVVLVIVMMIAAVTLPVVATTWRSQRIDAAAQVIQGELTAAIARARKGQTAGIRLMPDETITNRLANGMVDPDGILAWDRIVPLEQPPGYREGKLFLNAGGKPFEGAWDTPPSLNGSGGLTTASLYPQGRILLLIQARYRTEYDTSTTPPTPIYPLEAPTSWYWNVRRGDRIQVNETGPLLTVVGPMEIDNPEGFVNVVTDPATSYLRWPTPGGGGVDVDSYQPEFLFVVNGQDDDGDGIIDNGFNGVDDNLDGNVDEWEEWGETEKWPVAFNGSPQEVVGSAYNGVSYTLYRRPAPAAGTRGIQLAGAVIDGTRSLASTITDRTRSRLPVDRWSGYVDLMVDASGRWQPVRAVGLPTADGLWARWFHFWVANREELASPPAVTGDARLLTLDASTGGTYSSEADPAAPDVARRENERGAR